MFDLPNQYYRKYKMYISRVASYSVPVPGSVHWEVGVADLEPPWAEMVAGCWNQMRLYQRPHTLVSWFQFQLQFGMD